MQEVMGFGMPGWRQVTPFGRMILCGYITAQTEERSRAGAGNPNPQPNWQKAGRGRKSAERVKKISLRNN